jgi:hypothetical protein
MERFTKDSSTRYLNMQVRTVSTHKCVVAMFEFKHQHMYFKPCPLIYILTFSLAIGLDTVLEVSGLMMQRVQLSNVIEHICHRAVIE